ncbi:hypothetical protein BGZ63DRAFT_418959 [Mariannaea sp. PMI_226]|nr:hypothetical protein BGZ63DRAFT_418959 [Mariannaea sp. PMI_226]
MRPQVITAVVALISTSLILAFLIFTTPLNSLPALYDLSTGPESNTTEPSGSNVRYFVVFGDSWSRTGFQHNLTGPSSDANPSASNPIGNPKWPGETSTGGKNWIGYMISEFNSTLTLAWNFASGGCVIDRNLVRPRLETFGSFGQQIQAFNETIAQKPEYAPWTADNALAAIWFGINDLGRSYAFRNLTATVPRLVESLFDQAQTVYDLGLRQFMFLELAPFDLVPIFQLDVTNIDHTKARYFISTFNLHLRQQLDEFRDVNPDVRASLVLTSDIFWGAFMDPQAYGAPNTTCRNKNGMDCLWWDGAHPAQSIHKLIGERAAKQAWG